MANSFKQLASYLTFPIKGFLIFFSFLSYGNEECDTPNTNLSQNITRQYDVSYFDTANCYVVSIGIRRIVPLKWPLLLASANFDFVNSKKLFIPLFVTSCIYRKESKREGCGGESRDGSISHFFNGFNWFSFLILM